MEEDGLRGQGTRCWDGKGLLPKVGFEFGLEDIPWCRRQAAGTKKGIGGGGKGGRREGREEGAAFEW